MGCVLSAGSPCTWGARKPPPAATGHESGAGVFNTPPNLRRVAESIPPRPQVDVGVTQLNTDSDSQMWKGPEMVQVPRVPGSAPGCQACGPASEQQDLRASVPAHTPRHSSVGPRYYVNPGTTILISPMSKAPLQGGERSQSPPERM